MNSFGLFTAGTFAGQTMLMMITLLSFTDGMQIEVIRRERLFGENLTVDVQKTDTVATLKTKITEKLKEILHNQTGIPPDGQSLHYKERNALKLEDAKTLEQCGIKSDLETVFLELVEFGIFIEHQGIKHIFSVLANDYVNSLKDKIKEKLGIPPEEQILTRQKDGHVLCWEDRKMYFHDIVRGTFLTLNEVKVQYNGNSYAIEIFTIIIMQNSRESSSPKMVVMMDLNIIIFPRC
ncbi:hypothetical protein niasHS_018067 [Heterodera schachtii]|uniref:Ubiquitin-like domain-containing protein n=1 Tax=Heterodera schachtii TaxID=97005 RepID=A0ABD2HSC1_HETSC